MKMRDLMRLADNQFLSEAPYYDSVMMTKKQAVLDALDRLLGHQTIDRSKKVAALREIAEAAERMASGIEQRERDRQRQDDDGRM